MGARETIVAAAEGLFAERGIDAVSLREITRAAGERNVTALQYHFSDRQGLLVAVLENRARQLSLLMHGHMDILEVAQPPAASVVASFVSPLFAMTRTAGGRHFVQIAAEVIGRATRSPQRDDDPLRVLVDDRDGAIRRWAAMLGEHMSPQVNGGPLHQRFAMLRFAYIEAARRSTTDRLRRDTELFESHLTDLMTALAVCVPSEATTAALNSRFTNPRTNNASE